MQLNFVMLLSGRLNESYSGVAQSSQEFRDRYEKGEFEKEDNSEIESEELWVRDFDCPICKQRWQWLVVLGDYCHIQCKSCQTLFAVGMNDCANCIDRETKCLAVIPPKGLHP